MQFPKRTAAVVSALVVATLGMTPTAQASSDCTDYSDNNGAKARFVAYGEHLYVTDRFKDGHSAVAHLELWAGSHYFYWNTNGADTTRHWNLSIAEDRVYHLDAFLGNWDGTTTGGIDFSSNGLGGCNGTA